MSELEYTYDFGDGSTPVTQTLTNPDLHHADDTIEHVFPAGTHVVTVTLRERKGALVGRVLGTAQATVSGGGPTTLDYGGYTSGYSFPNYATSG
jgi:hypothetical protein